MLIVEVKKGNVDGALKIMRRKVKLTKQLLNYVMVVTILKNPNKKGIN